MQKIDNSIVNIKFELVNLKRQSQLMSTSLFISDYFLELE